VRENRERATQESPDVAALETERDEVKGQIEAILDSLSGAALKDAKGKLERLGTRRNEIESRLAVSRQARRRDDRSVDQVVADVMTVLTEKRQELLKLSAEPLRDAVNEFVSAISVDMETKEVSISLSVPSWAFLPLKNVKKQGENEQSGLCTATTSRSSTGSGTQQPFWLWDGTCGYARGQRDVCYECRRKAA
jgi:hypothetical protein